MIPRLPARRLVPRSTGPSAAPKVGPLTPDIPDEEAAGFVYPLVGARGRAPVPVPAPGEHRPGVQHDRAVLAVAIVIAVRIRKPEHGLPWYLFAAGQCAVRRAATSSRTTTSASSTPRLPFPSISDALYLSVYPCLIAGLLLLIHSRNPGRDRAQPDRLADHHDRHRHALLGLPDRALRARHRPHRDPGSSSRWATR